MLTIAVRLFLFVLALACPAAGADSGHSADHSTASAPLFEHGRVLIVQDRLATEAFSPRPAVVRDMLIEGLTHFTGKTAISQAWLSLVSTQDIIGIKINSAPGPNSGTRPAVVEQVIQTLLEAGIDAGHIIIWDRRVVDLRRAGFTALAEKYHVGTAGALDEGYDPDVSYSSSILGRLVYGDLEFGEKGEGIGRKSYVTKLLTRKITKIINIPALVNHNYAGVSGVMYGLAMSSVDNWLRFDEPDRLATAVPEIYALPEVGDRVVLNIIDALICQYRGEEQTLLHYSTALNQLWFSTDSVAVDVLAMREIQREKGDESNDKTGAAIYTNAGIMDLGISDLSQIQVETLRMH